MTSIHTAFPIPYTPFNIQRPMPPPIHREFSVSPASSTSTLVALEEDLPSSLYSKKLCDLYPNNFTTWDAFGLVNQKYRRSSGVLSLPQRTPTASHFTQSDQHAPSSKEPLTAATLLSTLLGPSPPKTPQSHLPALAHSQITQLQQLRQVLFQSQTQPLNHPSQQPQLPQASSGIDALRRQWQSVLSFLAGTTSPLDQNALREHAAFIITSCPAAAWTHVVITSLAAEFAKFAFEVGVIEPIVTEHGPQRDSTVPFAQQVFLALRAYVDENAAALFTRELVVRTVGFWFETWYPNYPSCILHRSEALPFPELVKHLNLCRFIGEMYKSNFITRAQIAECIRTLVHNIVSLEQIIALQYLIKHAGGMYWFEEKLVSLGRTSPYPMGAASPGPQEKHVLVDVGVFMNDLASKVGGIRNPRSLSEVKGRPECMLQCARTIIDDVRRWKDEIDRELQGV